MDVPVQNKSEHTIHSSLYIKQSTCCCTLTILKAKTVNYMRLRIFNMVKHCILYYTLFLKKCARLRQINNRVNAFAVFCHCEIQITSLFCIKTGLFIYIAKCGSLRYYVIHCNLYICQLTVNCLISVSKISGNRCSCFCYLL